MQAFLKSPISIGDKLPECSRKYTISDFRRGEEKTIHTDQTAAEREGLPGPVAIGPQVAALLFRVLRQAFGRAWVEGSWCSLTFRRPIPVDAFCTASGEVRKIEEHEGRLQVFCDVWVQDENGTKVIIGEAKAYLDQV